MLDASSGTLLKTIAGGGQIPFKSPVYITMFRPGKFVLISDLSLNAVLEINESTYIVTPWQKSANGPYGIAVNRKNGKIYAAGSSNATVNVYGGLLPANKALAQSARSAPAH